MSAIACNKKEELCQLLLPLVKCFPSCKETFCPSMCTDTAPCVLLRSSESCFVSLDTSHALRPSILCLSPLVTCKHQSQLMSALGSTHSCFTAANFPFTIASVLRLLHKMYM